MLLYRKAVVTAHIKQNTNATTLEKKVLERWYCHLWIYPDEIV